MASSAGMDPFVMQDKRKIQVLRKVLKWPESIVTLIKKTLRTKKETLEKRESRYNFLPAT